jgi:iron complex outermembrane receptor protein
VGGADKLTYFASFGMQRQEGIIKENDLNRYSGRFNATQRFWDDRLTIDVNLGVTVSNNDRPFFSTLLGQAISNNPTYPARNANGNPVFVAGVNNPLFSIDGEREMNTINRIIGSISSSLKIVKGLVYKLNFGIDNSNSTNDIQTKPSVSHSVKEGWKLFYNYNRNRLIENYVTYNWV